jgi:hypothetical protein
MINTKAVIFAQRAALGAIDDYSSAWLVQGFDIWLKSYGELSLERCLGLPKNPIKIRKEIRDGWLREASKLIHCKTSWERAKNLQIEANKFELRQWQCWKSARIPPSHASQLHGILFFALKSGSKLPTSIRQYARILE